MKSDKKPAIADFNLRRRRRDLKNVDAGCRVNCNRLLLVADVSLKKTLDKLFYSCHTTCDVRQNQEPYGL